MKFLPLVIFVFFCSTIAAQPLNRSALTIDSIMQGERFVGYSPTNITWSSDSKTIYFDKSNDKGVTERFAVSVETQTVKPLDIAAWQALESPSGDWNETYTQKFFGKNGDLFFLDLNKKNTRQITNTLKSEFNPEFSADGQGVIFQEENNLFTWDIRTGTTEQLTDFRKGQKEKKPTREGIDALLYADQIQYFQVLREREEKEKLQEELRDTLKPKRPLTIYCGEKQVSNLRLSKDFNFVTFTLTTLARNERTLVPDFVTASGYTENINARAKVGTPQNTYEFGIYDRSRDTFYLLDIQQIEGIFDKPAYLESYHNDTSAYKKTWEKPRSIVFHGAFHSPKGTYALLDIRALDNKDRWLMALDLKTATLTLLDRQHDEAWIGGAGIGEWDFYAGNLGWLDDETFFYQSEKTGFSHLYTMNVRTKTVKQLTDGNFEILDAVLSKDKKSFWITSNKETPFEHHFYKLSAKGGEMQKITPLAGGNEIAISPDENWLAIRHSTATQPWELYLMRNEIGAKPKQITHSTRPAFEAYDWQKPEIVRFQASDGAQVPARIYKPKQPNGAAVVFVHGAGYLQNVHDWWSNYYREFMFHNLLTDNGYTVLDIDYRASEGYGRDWRTAIYRFMGGRDLQDNLDGARYLVAQHGIDAERIGIYGGSYGGFITLMAMFDSTHTFKSGAALRSVTDWAHYNHGYTNNILNVPQLDSIAYRRSSPIYQAENLEGNLLILHGMIDDNVQFQDVVRLAQRLIELGKENWEFAVFPVEKHGFIEASSWTDEYKRIFKLFQTTIGN